MYLEANIDSIHTVEEQIRGHKRAIIKLKRTRNSLLNVSRLPPELLGEIFRWNITLRGDFDGLDKRSHNFLLVCHRWFEVASCAPESWTFWGNTPKDWARRSHRHGTTPIDLVLGYSHDSSDFNTALRRAPRSCNPGCHPTYSPLCPGFRASKLHNRPIDFQLRGSPVQWYRVARFVLLR